MKEDQVMSKKLVLVTGATGFIGSHLVRELIERGDEVVALVRRTSAFAPLESLGARLAFGDITDASSVTAAVEGVEVVYHLADISPPATVNKPAI